MAIQEHAPEITQQFIDTSILCTALMVSTEAKSAKYSTIVTGPKGQKYEALLTIKKTNKHE